METKRKAVKSLGVPAKKRSRVARVPSAKKPTPAGRSTRSRKSGAPFKRGDIALTNGPAVWPGYEWVGAPVRIFRCWKDSRSGSGWFCSFHCITDGAGKQGEKKTDFASTWFTLLLPALPK